MFIILIGDFMYKYNLFIINNNAYKIFKNNSNYLYNILNLLYHMKKTDMIYGISLYKDICDKFSVKLLNNYITERFLTKNINNKLLLKNNREKTYLRINYSNVFIESNVLLPQILKIFNIYNRKIFVIDFNNKKFFWLNDAIKKL